MGEKVKVTIYVGQGCERRVFWEGPLQVLPRIGEVVAIDMNAGYEVQSVSHVLSKKGAHEAILYVR